MQRYEDSDFSQAPSSSLYGEKAVFEKGRAYRIGFPCVKEGTDDVIKRNVRFFRYSQEIFRRKLIVPQDPELYKAMENLLGHPEVRSVTPIIIYRTDASGQVVKGDFRWDVLPFVFDLKKKAAALSQINMVHKLSRIDVMVLCNEPKYQELIFTPVNQCIWRDLSAADPNFKESLDKAVRNCVGNMHESIALEYSDEVLRKMLNDYLGVNSPSSQSGQNSPFHGPSAGPAAPSGTTTGDSINVSDLLIR